MTYLKSILFGAAAGIVGAGIWAAIAYTTGYEVGWIAWAIGGLVGVAVRFATAPEVSYTGDAAEDAIREIEAESDQLGPGAIAATIAIVSVLVGKFLAVTLFISNISAGDLGEELLISYVADDVALEYAAAGRSLTWPADVDPQYATAQADYPAEVWAEATRRWQARSPEERAQFASETAAAVTAMMEQNASGAFLASFGGMDFLWFGLAAWTAFKIGAAGNEE